MGNIRRYVVVSHDGTDQDYEHETYDGAVEAAQRLDPQGAVMERVYVLEDSELVWTPDGGDVWPPERVEHDEDQEDDTGVREARRIDGMNLAFEQRVMREGR